MDFSFSAEHEMVRKMVRDFADKEIRPYVKDNDRAQQFDRSLLPKMAAQGLLGISVPVRYGGAGMDYISLGIISEELEYADTSARVIISSAARRVDVSRRIRPGSVPWAMSQATR